MLGNYNYLHCGERKFGFKEETRDGETNKGDNETHMWSVEEHTRVGWRRNLQF